MFVVSGALNANANQTVLLTTLETKRFQECMLVPTGTTPVGFPAYVIVNVQFCLCSHFSLFASQSYSSFEKQYDREVKNRLRRLGDTRATHRSTNPL